MTRAIRTSKALTGSLLALAAAFGGCAAPNLPLVEAEAFYAGADYYQAYVASLLKRAIRTMWLALDEMDRMWQTWTVMVASICC